MVQAGGAGPSFSPSLSLSLSPSPSPHLDISSSPKPISYPKQVQELGLAPLENAFTHRRPVVIHAEDDVSSIDAREHTCGIG